jgi:5-methyltetrahydrofolate--homocysteine methyltransferase
MELEFKPDFDAARKRWDAFWRGKNPQPMLLAQAPREGMAPVAYPLCTQVLEGDFRPLAGRVIEWARAREFLGDAMPWYYLEFGPDQFSTFLGCDMIPAPDGRSGGWAVHNLEEIETADIRFRPEGKWWRRYTECAQILRERCEGRMLVASCTLVANLDSLTALRGAQRLHIDLVENPEAVRRALAQITAAHQDILDALAKLYDYPRLGSITRHGVYSRGRTNVPQCDFSCMISPAMFREFVLPCLRAEMARMDGVTYHLDGPDSIRHLEALCEIEDLDIIQWQPGAGNAAERDWTPLYERILALGKTVIYHGSADSFLTLAKHLGTRKLIGVISVKTRGEYEACREKLEGMTFVE